MSVVLELSLADEEWIGRRRKKALVRKRLSSSFGNKKKRQNQLVARLKRKRGYAKPIPGGTGKQARSRKSKFAKHAVHDQKTHGNWARATGSSILWKKRPLIPVVNVKHDSDAKLALGTGDAWIVTVEETEDPVIVFRGMTSLKELRDGPNPGWPKWRSRGHVVDQEAERGTSFGQDPDETFLTPAIGSWRTGEYQGELFSVQVAADLRGLQGITLTEPVDGFLEADRGLGLSIIEDVPIDRVAAIRVLDGYWDYRAELADLGSRPSTPAWSQDLTAERSEVEGLRQMGKPYKRKKAAIAMKEAAWSKYWDDKSDYNRKVTAVSNSYKDNGYIEFRGPEAHEFIARGKDLDRPGGFEIYQAISSEAEFSPFAVVKHLPGQHDQKTHGRRKAGGIVRGDVARGDDRRDGERMSGPHPPVPGNLGECYSTSGRFLLHEVGSDNDATLVHGVIRNPGGDVAHGWVELDDGFIYEPATDAVYHPEDFEHIFHPITLAEYPTLIGMGMIAKSKHWGPWDSMSEKWYKTYYEVRDPEGHGFSHEWASQWATRTIIQEYNLEER